MSRRWISVTLEANLVRNVASSTAESPPPTTAISWPRKKNPSQVAHVDRPWPSSSTLGFEAEHQALRAGGDDDRVGGELPVAHARRNGRSLKSTAVTFSVRNSAPKRSACSRKRDHQLRAHDAVGEAGEVLDVGGQHQLAAGLVAGAGRLALDDERGEVGPGGVDGGGEPGGAGADDDDVVVARHSLMTPATSTWLCRLRMQIAPPSEQDPTHQQVRHPHGAVVARGRRSCEEVLQQPGAGDQQQGDRRDGGHDDEHAEHDGAERRG